MFIRTKKSGHYEYLQVAHNERVNGKVRQRVIATLGRLDHLKQSGKIDALIASWRIGDIKALLPRFQEH